MVGSPHRPLLTSVVTQNRGPSRLPALTFGGLPMVSVAVGAGWRLGGIPIGAEPETRSQTRPRGTAGCRNLPPILVLRMSPRQWEGSSVTRARWQPRAQREMLMSIEGERP